MLNDSAVGSGRFGDREDGSVHEGISEGPVSSSTGGGGLASGPLRSGQDFFRGGVEGEKSSSSGVSVSTGLLATVGQHGDAPSHRFAGERDKRGDQADLRLSASCVSRGPSR